MNARERSGSLQHRLRERFSAEFPIPSGTEEHLAAALSESTARTGNFVRAQLAFAVGRAYGASDEVAMQLAIALEYFHTASLIFDDLPSMDDATHRRGAECVHRLFGEGTAILAALALINRGYMMLWQCFAHADANRNMQAARYAERYLGLEGLLNGQSWDIHYGVQSMERRRPQRVARGKTVGLIRLALVLPALLNGAAPRVVKLLDHLAVFWGLAYQAIDDFKDVLHTSALTGKTTARDRALDRPNLVLARGMKEAVRVLRRLSTCSETVLDRLIDLDPKLSCLEPARALLSAEIAKVLTNACEVAA